MSFCSKEAPIESALPATQAVPPANQAHKRSIGRETSTGVYRARRALKKSGRLFQTFPKKAPLRPAPAIGPA
jgi:hypothetical protein